MSWVQIAQSWISGKFSPKRLHKKYKASDGRLFDTKQEAILSAGFEMLHPGIYENDIMARYGFSHDEITYATIQAVENVLLAEECFYKGLQKEQ